MCIKIGWAGFLMRSKDHVDNYFIDLGCKYGKSLIYCSSKFGIPVGIGVEIEKQRVYETKKVGYEVIYCDARKLPFKEKSVVFISMLDFLEHLPSKKEVENVLKQSKFIARDFLYINHPSFEEIDYLKSIGFKITWTDWRVHLTHLTVKDFRRIFTNLKLKNYTITPQDLVKDSSDKHIIPISPPQDTKMYKKIFSSKPYVKFVKPIYKRFEIYVPLRDDIKRWHKNEFTTKLSFFIKYIRMKLILLLASYIG